MSQTLSVPCRPPREASSEGHRQAATSRFRARLCGPQARAGQEQPDGLPLQGGHRAGLGEEALRGESTLMSRSRSSGLSARPPSKLRTASALQGHITNECHGPSPRSLPIRDAAPRTDKDRDALTGCTKMRLDLTPVLSGAGAQTLPQPRLPLLLPIQSITNAGAQTLAGLLLILHCRQPPGASLGHFSYFQFPGDQAVPAWSSPVVAISLRIKLKVLPWPAHLPP